MSVNVNYFKEYYELIARKTKGGNTLTPEQFNKNANQAQLAVFEKDRNIFLQTKQASDYLSYFLRTYTGAVDSLTGFVPYPNDWQHTASVRAYNVLPNQNSNEIEVMEVNARDWGKIQLSQLNPPVYPFYKYSEFRYEYRFLPKSIGIVMIDYFHTPVIPIWNYTIINDTPVYNPTGSVDFEWSEFAINNVMAEFLQIIGINLQDQVLMAFSKMYKDETNSTL